MTFGRGLLIAGGVALGGYVLYRLLAPSAPPLTRRPGSQYTAVDGSIIGGLASLGSAIANAVSPSGPNAYGPQNLNFFNSPAAAGANYNDPTVYTTSAGSYSAGAIGNYGYADTHPGSALPEGVYGPPVPAAGLSDDANASNVELA